MSKLFQLRALVSGVRTTADKGLELKLRTQDVQTFEPEHLSILMSTIDKEFIVAFSEQDIKAEDIEEMPEVTVEKDWKTPSQRLRGVLYRLWEQGEKKLPFPVYYESKMESLINQFKEKLG